MSDLDYSASPPKACAVTEEPAGSVSSPEFLVFERALQRSSSSRRRQGSRPSSGERHPAPHPSHSGRSVRQGLLKMRSNLPGRSSRDQSPAPTTPTRLPLGAGGGDSPIATVPPSPIPLHEMRYATEVSDGTMNYAMDMEVDPVIFQAEYCQRLRFQVTESQFLQQYNRVNSENEALVQQLDQSHQRLCVVLGGYQNMQQQLQQAMQQHQSMMGDALHASETIENQNQHIQHLYQLLQKAGQAYQELKTNFEQLWNEYTNLQNGNQMLKQHHESFCKEANDLVTSLRTEITNMQSQGRLHEQASFRNMDSGMSVLHLGK